jgi:L-aminopeptidase/D-esterase-like protein
LAVGIAEYEEGPTGCTVIAFDEPAELVIDVRGGAPYVVGDFGVTDAICLTGGSVYGIEAVAGVNRAILEARNFDVGWQALAAVAGAVIYDFQPRNNAVHPDVALGYAAWQAKQPGRFPLGAQGAGRSASAGKGFRFDRAEQSGQGGAVRQIGDTHIAFFTVTNPVGAIHDRTGKVVCGHRNPDTGEREPLTADLDTQIERSMKGPSTNTTLSVLVIDQKLPEPGALGRIARQVHASMARAIQPFHMAVDGDVLFAVNTNRVDGTLHEMLLATAACELAWDAILASVPEESCALRPETFWTSVHHSRPSLQHGNLRGSELVLTTDY